MTESNKFFKELKKYNLLNDYTDILDWIFNDEKFHSWDSKMKTNYTNKIKKYAKKNKIIFEEKKLKELQEISLINKTFYMYFTKSSTDGSICVSCIRHIRNSLAHAHLQVKIKNEKICLSMKDNNKNKTSAQIYIPLETLKYLYDTYIEINTILELVLS